MAWSTRQLAQIAGVSIRTVRYYHDVGLLELPERESNGYKQYGVGHVVALLRIRGLVGLGFSLAQIVELQQPDLDPTSTLRELEAQLDAQVAQLQSAREQVAGLLRSTGATGASPEFHHDLSRLAETRLSAADRDLLVVLTRVVRADVSDSLIQIARHGEDDPTLAELDALAADADEAVREDLAARLGDYLAGVHREHPALLDVTSHATLSPRDATRTIRTAIEELYNAAQVDVVTRAATRARSGRAERV